MKTILCYGGSHEPSFALQLFSKMHYKITRFLHINTAKNILLDFIAFANMFILNLI